MGSGMQQRGRSWRLVLAAASATSWLVGATGAEARQAERPVVAAPAYRPLRFDEDWSVLARGRTGDPLDPLKYIPLGEKGRLSLGFGGQIRYRVEGVDDYLLGGAGDRDDVFGLTRLRMHAELRAGSTARIFVEGKHATAHGRDLPGGRRASDHDEADIQNAFVEVGCCASPDRRAILRVGRQELLLGSQRLVSPVDWSNARRTFDGARLLVAAAGAKLDAFWLNPVTVYSIRSNRRDKGTELVGAVVGAARPLGGVTPEFVALRLRQSDSVNFAGNTGLHDRTTIGGRIAGNPAGSRYLIAAEGGYQFGELGERRTSAWYLAGDLGRSFPDAPLAPTLTAGFDWASGDDDPTDDEAGTFHPLYALSHGFAGYTDVVERQNLLEMRAVVTLAPARGTRARIAGHHFLRASPGDAAYAGGGAILRPADGSRERAIGSELDVTIVHRVGRHVQVEVGYGRFVPGRFLTERPGGATSVDWGFTSMAFTF